MMHAGTAAAATAGATGAGGMWLFSYNKENFGYDAGMRFGRFMTARGFANSQVEQYREDIEGITAMTVTKMDAWQSVTTLFLAVGAALSCAGRIGMHGAAPPNWYCALFSGSIFMSVMFNGISLWLSMHASLRAQCAQTSLLTRKVRLPIPSMDQLDQARVFGSAFEKQDYRDIFRVPFMRHAQDAPAAVSPEAGKGKAGKKGKKKGAEADSSDGFGSTARDTVPSWIRDEVVVDKGNGFIGDDDQPVHEELELPDHFKMLMKAQEEWRNYDIYARISMLYGVISFLYAVTYYAVGYAIVELRGFWVMWTLPMVFITAQALVLRLDILRTGQHRLPNAELLGHAAPFFAVAACCLEYRYYYSRAQVAVTFALALLAVFGHFVMALRMLDLAWPDASVTEDMPEEPGRQWWPASWKVPSAFSRNLWFITPPKQLQEGQSCLVHEMQDLAAQGGGVASKGTRAKSPKSKKATPESAAEAANDSTEMFGSIGDMGMKRGNDLPWRIVRVAILSAAFQWFFIMVTIGVEIVLGTETLLKPPGEAPWIRDTKMRSWTPGMVHLSNAGALPEDYRLFSASTANYVQGGSAGHRRLSQAATPIDDLLRLLPDIAEFAERLEATASAPAAVEPELPQLAPDFLAAAPEVKRVSWPGLFEPRHLLCGPNRAAVALTPRGFGAMAPLDEDGDVVAEPFALDGLASEGPLAGGAWTPSGLQLVTASGRFVHCPGHTHQEGIWNCAPAEHPPLPVPRGSVLLSAAIAHEDQETPLVALLFKHAPSLAAIFRASEGQWHPAGEVHLPFGGGQLAFGAGARELLVTAADGEIHRRHLGGGAHAVHPAPLVSERREFRSACDSPDGGVLRLALRKNERAAGIPELISTP